MESFGDLFVPFPFLFSLSAQQTHLGSVKICLAAMCMEVTCHAL